jgi:glycosyltransferase involved in cell wall biosynthesis
MRVLFDGYWWRSGPLANRTVQREFILAWARVFPDDEIVVAVRGADRPVDLPKSMAKVSTRLWPHALSNRLELARYASSVRADAVIAHNYAPRRAPGARSVVFIHDVMFAEHPEWFSRKERVYFAPMLPWSAGADAVATSTRTEADRIRRHGRGARAPIAVTGLAPPATLTGAGRRPPGVPESQEFAITVGRLNVRKNLAAVLRAAGASGRITSRSPLYVVGGTAHSGRGPGLGDDVEALRAEGRVVFLGPIPDDELTWMYAHAALTVSLSLDEGFGMPAVEAALHGSPLVVSDIPVFRETVGEYARFVDPLAEAGVVAEAIDAEWGHRPGVTARRAVVDAFTWERAAGVLRAAATR